MASFTYLLCGISCYTKNFNLKKELTPPQGTVWFWNIRKQETKVIFVAYCEASSVKAVWRQGSRKLASAATECTWDLWPTDGGPELPMGVWTHNCAEGGEALHSSNVQLLERINETLHMFHREVDISTFKVITILSHFINTQHPLGEQADGQPACPGQQPASLHSRVLSLTVTLTQGHTLALTWWVRN